MKVVRRRDFLASGICQNHLLASNLQNICAPVSWASVSSTFGSGCTLKWPFSLSGFLTFETTPIDSIQSSSSFTFGRSDSGTCLGVNRQWGVTPDLR